MKKYTFTLIILFLSYCVIYGQLSTNEVPMSLKTNVPTLRATERTQKLMPSLSMKKIEQEDLEDETRGRPPRFGYKHEVNYNLENSGEWTNLPDGSKLWRLTISSPGALSINLLYDKFWIPEGAKFFIYSDDRKHSLGAFTSVNNNGDKNDIEGFATGLVYSDKITLEYYLPNDIKDVGVISVAYVIHGYKHIILDNNTANATLRNNATFGYGASESCI